MVVQGELKGTEQLLNNALSYEALRHEHVGLIEEALQLTRLLRKPASVKP
ncbi:hypothetical protein KEJ37_03560 [Candidatus Bathyarchaeota archaeon]|nr:hypothetical protein [Candidatus Bathyarchaeota archaeon]